MIGLLGVVAAVDHMMAQARLLTPWIPVVINMRSSVCLEQNVFQFYYAA